jgi:CheY-like chemotaxis protein
MRVAMSAHPAAPILIVEDNGCTRGAIASLLNAVGYVTVTVRNGEEGLDYLHAGNTPCLIILDLALGGGMSGQAFRSALLENERLARIPVLVYTALSDPPPVPKVVARLRKSIEPDQLLAAIAKACAPSESSDGAD